MLDHTSQGDIATLSDDPELSSVALMGPQQLYELWERQHWQSQAIGLERDRRDWQSLTAEERGHIAWALSSFFIGEERVTTQFSGLVMAYESQGEEAFLATQLVDEARHAQHFNRFYEHVVGYDGTFEDRLSRAREDVNDGFAELFDRHLVRACERLVEDPGDVEAKVDFVTTYHMVIEGTLALTGQHYLTQFLERRGVLPGFVEGFKLIARDEHRHVAYGTWFLRQKCREHALARRAEEKLAELLPVAASVLVPPGLAPGDPYEVLGCPSDEVSRFAFTALRRRLRVIGIGIPAATA